MTVEGVIHPFPLEGDLRVLFPVDQGRPDVLPVSKPPSLKLMQDWLKGWVELADQFGLWVPKGPHVDVQVYVNEEGRLRGMQDNSAATFWLRSCRSRWLAQPPLVGPVVVLVGKGAIWR